MKRIAIVFLLSSISLAADPAPYLKSAPMPFYPPIARAARIEGSVALRFVVDAKGETSAVEATTGHVMLRQAAVDNIRNWKFAWPQPCECRVSREVVFSYKLSGKERSAESATTTVKWFGSERIEVETDSAPVIIQNAY